MKAEDLTVGQWWIVAVATSALFMAAFYFCFRHKKATLYSVIAPALGAVSVMGHSFMRGHTEPEALVIYSASMFSLALLLFAMRPEVRQMEKKHRLGETYEVSKLKSGLYGLLVTTLAIVIVFLVL
ncbi:hypothetical protein [Streptomyces sp. TRM68367]|uniref:hypothetical protein n=1 Tax=Streptomyces sp. TRM68367 TaxID=2758415 RepID=UPI00165A3403|nr:hypothetical protein [Streptomyces sp. TRM68367]MBC9727855.1 hypothetical protein [Streptomyces sp. TRM68367]